MTLKSSLAGIYFSKCSFQTGLSVFNFSSDLWIISHVESARDFNFTRTYASARPLMSIGGRFAASWTLIFSFGLVKKLELNFIGAICYPHSSVHANSSSSSSMRSRPHVSALSTEHTCGTVPMHFLCMFIEQNSHLNVELTFQVDARCSFNLPVALFNQSV